MSPFCPSSRRQPRRKSTASSGEKLPTVLVENGYLGTRWIVLGKAAHGLEEGRAALVIKTGRGLPSGGARARRGQLLGSSLPWAPDHERRPLLLRSSCISRQAIPTLTAQRKSGSATYELTLPLKLARGLLFHLAILLSQWRKPDHMGLPDRSEDFVDQIVADPKPRPHLDGAAKAGIQEAAQHAADPTHLRLAITGLVPWRRGGRLLPPGVWRLRR